MEPGMEPGMDWTRIATLRDEIGADDLPEVVALFLDEAAEVVHRIGSGATDGAVLAADLHSLKGTALNLGFDRVAALCRAAEPLAAAGRGAEIDRMAIAEGFAADSAALRRHLQAGGA
ncbi:MAG: Hpt domain-containing protein [Rhodobacteraceae bacterium]|nr:Hpt domain-containing protein [Paracoccaceae bacterium]